MMELAPRGKIETETSIAGITNIVLKSSWTNKATLDVANNIAI
jgi:hypothetical protein